MSPFPTDLAHFDAGEFSFPEQMDVGFLRWLDRVRERAGVPFVITNDAHARPHDSKSLHPRGRAVDIRSREWTPEQKWRVAAAIIALAPEAPGAVEWETVFSPIDAHWHVAVDDRPGAVHELLEADD